MNDARLASFIVRRWVRLYTSGLERTVRDERRAEMESDLWENSENPAPRWPPGAEIMFRSLLGVPADMSWRLEQARTGERIAAVLLGAIARLEALTAWIVRRGLPALTSVLIWAYIAGGVLLVGISPFQTSGQAGFALVGAWGILAGLGVRWARTAMKSRPVAGFLSLLFGALPLALLLTATVVAPILAGTVTVAEGRRAWTIRRAMQREGPFHLGD